LIFHACQEGELPAQKEVFLELPETPFQYSVGVNDELPTLGRVLFYDKQLSLNNSVSCASCHKQAFAFADNVAFSRGFENRLTLRNSMPIQNLGSGFFGGVFGDSSSFIEPGFGPFFQALFWDGREHNLNQMVLRPVVNHVEMGITDVTVWEQKIGSIPYYKELFSKAYGTEDVSHQKIADALSSFIRSITSQNTKFDKASFNVDPGFDGNGTQFTPMELLGQSLFIEKYDCNACHQVQQPNGYIFAGTFANVGLDPVYADNGLGEFTNHEFDNGKFKIPSLRNVVLTGPYMHDGRFKTLTEVIDHYSTGIADHPNLDVRLKGGNNRPMQMDITDHEKQAIIAFLNTLTDYNMVTDPKFSDPFKAK
jgi:cytochrome c peroxidase